MLVSVKLTGDDYSIFWRKSDRLLGQKILLSITLRQASDHLVNLQIQKSSQSQLMRQSPTYTPHLRPLYVAIDSKHWSPPVRGYTSNNLPKIWW